MMFNFFKKERKLETEIESLCQDIMAVIRKRYGNDKDVGQLEAAATITSCIGIAIACTKACKADPGSVAEHFLKTMMINFPGMGKFANSKAEVLDLLKEDEKPIGFCPPNVTKH
jgi:hypothetical protein